MQTARNVFREHVGAEREAEVFKQHAHDLDSYIEAACSEPTKGLLCKKCKKHSVIIELKQTRSADEGMTAYAKCLACYHQYVYS